MATERYEANEPTATSSTARAAASGDAAPPSATLEAPGQPPVAAVAVPAPPPAVVVKDHGLWCDIIHGRTASLPYWLAIVCLIINVLLSGVGTLISAIHPNARGMRCKIVIIGLIQLIFLWTFVPWVWSVVYGALLVKHAKRSGPDTN